jgi:hypothetical protein
MQNINYDHLRIAMGVTVPFHYDTDQMIGTWILQRHCTKGRFLIPNLTYNTTTNTHYNPMASKDKDNSTEDSDLINSSRFS